METTEKKETNTKEILKRGEFLRSLGVSSAALMAFYCMGTLTSCSTGEEPGPMNSGGTPPGGNSGGMGGGGASTGLTGTTSGSSIDFTIDLKSDTYKKLTTVGEFAIIGDTIVIHTSTANNYVALSKACTHAGTTVQYRKNSNDIWCDNHGSEFNLDGTVKKSPAATPLKVYRATLSQSGDTLTVKA